VQLKKLLAKNRINNNHNDKYKWSQIFDERLHPKNFPFPKGIWASTSYKYMVPWGHLVHIPNSISIGLSVLAQLKLMSTDRHTHHVTSVSTVQAASLHSVHAMWPNNALIMFMTCTS